MLPCLTPLCIWHVLESIEFHLTFFFVFMYMLSLGIMQKGHPGRWGANRGWWLRKSYFAMFCYYNYSVNIDQHNQNINNLVHCFPPPLPLAMSGRARYTQGLSGPWPKSVRCHGTLLKLQKSGKLILLKLSWPQAQTGSMDISITLNRWPLFLQN